MVKKRAAITGIGAFVPNDILDNFELSRMVDTSDEWIMQRVGIKERRILKDKNKASSYMAVKAIKELLKKTDTSPEEIDFLVLYLPIGAAGFGFEDLRIHKPVIDAFIKSVKALNQPAAFVIPSMISDYWQEEIPREQRRCFEAGLPAFSSFRDAARAISSFVQYCNNKSA